MRSVLAWVGIGAAVVLTAEVFRAAFIACITVGEQWVLACLPKSFCDETRYLVLRDKCNDAAKVCPKGVVWAVLEEVVANTRVCIGFDCAEALRDARSTLMFAAGGLVFLLWQSGMLRYVAVRWWRDRPKRNMLRFEKASEAKLLE